jgi:hypothetical protein
VIGPTRGLQKIGMATDPQARLASLQTASPIDLLIHAAIAVPFGAAPDVEHQAHCLLGRMCVRNEWFEARPAEAPFAVYTAALPWMQKLMNPTPSEPRENPALDSSPLPSTASLRTITEAPTKLPRQGILPAELLPLFQPRTTSAVEERKIGLLEPGT